MTNEVGRIGWAQTAIGNSYLGGNSQANKEDATETGAPAAAYTGKAANPEDVLAAMSTLGNYNLVNVNKADATEINPADYLSEERIAEIEAMMGEFENGVEELVGVIEEELPDDVSQATIYALAASMHAQE